MFYSLFRVRVSEQFEKAFSGAGFHIEMIHSLTDGYSLSKESPRLFHLIIQSSDFSELRTGYSQGIQAVEFTEHRQSKIQFLLSIIHFTHSHQDCSFLAPSYCNFFHSVIQAVEPEGFIGILK